MTADRDPGRQTANLKRCLLLLYLAFVIYGSLVPLNFVYRPVGDAIAAFGNIEFFDIGIGSRADWVANALLFIPLTFLASMLLTPTRRRSPHLPISLLLILASILLATGIEFTQLFFPGRTVGQNDIYAESVGGILGIVAQRLYGHKVDQWLQSFWSREHQHDRVTRLLHAYLVVFFVFSVMPLDLTLSPIEFYHKWTEGRIILMPFLGIKGGLAPSIYKYATDVIIWIPVGLLWSMQRSITFRTAILRGMGAGLIIELLQLFVYSRVTSVTDVLLAATGAGVGHWLFHATGSHLALLAVTSVRLWRSLWVCWLLMVLGVFWFPFDFDFSRLGVSSAYDGFRRLPFVSYYMTSEFHALNEMLRKLGFFLPGGLLLGLASRRRPSSASAWLMGLLIAAVPLMVEIGQLAIPDKVGDLTDVLIEAAGSWMGFLAAGWLQQPVAKATAPNPTLQPRPAAAVVPRQAAHANSGWPSHLIRVLVLVAAVAIATNLSGMHYDVRKLVSPGIGGAMAVAGLALAAYWIAVGPLAILPQAGQAPGRLFFAFPLALLGHALVTWCLFRVSTPNPVFLKIVGAPVLDWPWEFEALLRYLALHVSLLTQMLGAVLLVRAVNEPKALVGFIYWLLISLVLAWPLYLVILEWAATDNLTELIRDNASFAASSSLAAAMLLAFVTAGSLGAMLGDGRRKRWLFGLGALAALGATVLFGWALEPTLVKYGKVFSAAQFLLSEDREHYAQGNALLIRYVFAFAGFTIALALLQVPYWRNTLNSTKTV